MTTNLMGTASATVLLHHLFLNGSFANVGGVEGLPPSATAGSLYIGLHTAVPLGSDQTSHEFADSGYIRQAVARTTAGWTAADVPDGGDISIANAVDIVFPEVISTTATLTHASIGVASAGAFLVLFAVQLDTPLVTEPDGVPKIPAGALRVFIAVNDG